MEENKGAAEVAERKTELEKCRDSAYYFFTKYVTVDGKPANTFLTEEEFNNLYNAYTNNLKIKARRCR